MLHTLRKRIERDEDGFTLIELMVVVLIIAILLAIAIPTFLGARQKAQDRAAQSNLRNAFTAQKTIFTDNEAYTTEDDTMEAVEPSLTFDEDANQAPTQGNISYNVDANGVLTIATKSVTGTCFYLKDVPTGTTSGTYYAKNTTCTTPSATTVNGAKWS